MSRKAGANPNANNLTAEELVLRAVEMQEWEWDEEEADRRSPVKQIDLEEYNK